MQVLGKDSFLSHASQGIKVDYQMISGLNKRVSLNKKLPRKKFRWELSFMNLQQMASKFMSWNKLQRHSKSMKKPLTCKQEKNKITKCQSFRQKDAAKTHWISLNSQNMEVKVLVSLPLHFRRILVASLGCYLKLHKWDGGNTSPKALNYHTMEEVY